MSGRRAESGGDGDSAPPDDDSAGDADPGGNADPPSVAAVRDRLDRVDDPELARSIVDLDYIDRIDIDGDRVAVGFTLPTAWCSPAFAWMMATDARDEVESLGWVREARIELHDHMHADGITTGVNARDTFGETFPDADGGVREIRASLDDKARLARQHDAVDALLDGGVTPAQIADLRRGNVTLVDEDGERVAVEDAREHAEAAHVALDGVTVVVDADPLGEYLRYAEASGRVTDPDAVLFRTPDGDPIPVDRFDVVQKRARLAGVNVGGQGAVCDALHEARHGPDGPESPGESTP